MKLTATAALAVLLALSGGQARAADPPAAGKGMKWTLTEAEARQVAPVFEFGLRQSRDSARGGATEALPAAIRGQVRGFYDDELLDSVRFKTGDNDLLNLANLSIRFGDAAAVTLVDTIVFADAAQARSNVLLWVHELWHVKQFRDWGVRDFSLRYLQDSAAVEAEAYAAQDNFTKWRARHSRGN
jgi:hypothetical protein